MKKSDKKIEKQLCKTLTEVCEFALEDINGYQWITHTVKFDSFPKSLIVTCAFASQKHIDELIESGQSTLLKKLIVKKLGEVNIRIDDQNKQVKWMVEA